MQHQIGHLPFEAEISNELIFGQENRITVLVGKEKEEGSDGKPPHFNLLYPSR